VARVPKIVGAFCDSPYLLQDEYEETLRTLTDAFYTYKNETRDLLTDDELLGRMRARYDAYEGSLEAVTGMPVKAFFERGRPNEREDWEPEEDE
jgi:hypothetical protein